MHASQTISDIARRHLAWSMVDGVGPIVFGHLQRVFGDLERAWGASAAELERVPRIGPKSAATVARSRDAALPKAEQEIAGAAQHGVRILCQQDDAYPAALRRISDPPIVIYVKGALQPTDAVALAIVGTRRCSIYGGEQARRFGELFAGAGFTVVSGLARGVDAFAHHGAVDVGGRSIAVLGNGLHEIYPPENEPLARKLLDHGCLISELPMTASVQRENFPSRNRIIAGLSLGVLVVEAPTRSGALITARLASDYNREVFALPGRLQEPAAQGVNALIRDGVAKLVMGLEDVLTELGELGYTMGLKQPTNAVSSPQRSEPEDQAATLFGAGASTPDAGLSRIEQRVLEAAPPEAVLQDVLIRASELPAHEVLSALTTLELRGLVKRLPGQQVMRVNRA